MEKAESLDALVSKGTYQYPCAKCGHGFLRLSFEDWTAGEDVALCSSAPTCDAWARVVKPTEVDFSVSRAWKKRQMKARISMNMKKR